MKILLSIHVVSWLCGLILFFTTPDKCFVRGNADLICWGVVAVTAILLFFQTRGQKSMRWASSLALFEGLIISAAMLLCVAKHHKNARVAETSRYVVRRITPGFIFNIDPRDFVLFEKDGLWEKRCCVLASDELVYNLEDFQVYEEWAAVSFRLVLNETWQKEWDRKGAENAKYHVLSFDEEASKPYQQQIENLKSKLNASN